MPAPRKTETFNLRYRTATGLNARMEYPLPPAGAQTARVPFVSFLIEDKAAFAEWVGHRPTDALNETARKHLTNLPEQAIILSVETDKTFGKKYDDRREYFSKNNALSTWFFSNMRTRENPKYFFCTTLKTTKPNRISRTRLAANSCIKP